MEYHRQLKIHWNVGHPKIITRAETAQDIKLTVLRNKKGHVKQKWSNLYLHPEIASQIA